MRSLHDVYVRQAAWDGPEHWSGPPEMVERIAAITKPGSSDRVLDAGCGLGGPARRLAGLIGCTVVGVDVVEEVVRAARQAGLGLYADVKTMTVAAAERLALLLDSENMINKTILASVRSDIVMCCAPATSGIPWAVLFASTLEDPVQLAASINASYVHPCWERLPRPDQLLAGAWLDRVRAHGLGVITWHEERPAVVQSLYELGVDGIGAELRRLQQPGHFTRRIL